MSQELPSVVTPITINGLANAMLVAWFSERNPTRAQVRLAVAQIAHETGIKSCRCYNLGGIKASPSGNHDYQYFTTTERVPVAQAQAEIHNSAGLVTVNPGTEKDGYVYVTVRPKHRWSCFRAYDSLASAMRDHLALIASKPNALAGLLTGEPARFARGLKVNRWFTAEESAYAQALRNWLPQVAKATPDDWLGWGDVL